jgi:glycerophosphoryl diester phosphodiesterase
LTSSSERRRAPGHPYLAGSPLLIAHRGGALLAPENTLLAFERALTWWDADVLELDVQPSREGEAVVLHDATLDRTTDGTGPVRALPLPELRRLDAGHRFTPDGRTFPFRGRGIGIPTLAEVLDTFPAARLNVEIKDAACAPAVLRAIERAGARHRVLVAAGSRRNRVPGYRPNSAAVGDVRLYVLLHFLGLGRLRRPAVDAFQVPEERAGRRWLTPRIVAQLQSMNVPVHVWTVNLEADMERLLEWGVDGIITDRPDLLARLLHRVRGRALPPGIPDPPPEAFLTALEG